MSFAKSIPFIVKPLRAWYLDGGIERINCIAAYQPIRAVSLTSSYINLAHPGINNAVPIVAPLLNFNLGWVFNNVTTYLTTGIVPLNNQTWSMIVAYTNRTAGDKTIVGTYDAVNKEFRITLSTIPNLKVCGNGQNTSVAPANLSGIISFSGNRAYLNGIEFVGAVPYPIPVGVGNIIGDIFIGCVNFAGVPVNFFGGQIQALAIYNRVLTSAQNLIIATRIAAL